MTKDPKTGVIQVNEEECDGCCWCLQSCEFGAITFDLDKRKVAMCDLCGLDPQCVKFCPKDALALSAPEQISQKLRIEAIKKLSKTNPSEP